MTDIFDIYMKSFSDRNQILDNISRALQKPGASILVDRHNFSRLFGYLNFCDGTRNRAEQWFNSLSRGTLGRLKIDYAARSSYGNDLLCLSVY